MARLCRLHETRSSIGTQKAPHVSPLYVLFIHVELNGTDMGLTARTRQVETSALSEFWKPRNCHTDADDHIANVG
jgi:hypothetical protein